MKPKPVNVNTYTLLVIWLISVYILGEPDHRLQVILTVMDVGLGIAAQRVGWLFTE